MTALRAVLILAIIVGLAITPALVRFNGLSAWMSLPAYAATLTPAANVPARGPRHPEKDDNRKHENTNDNRDNGNGNSNDNSNSNGNGNGNGNGNNNSNDNDSGSSSPPPPPRQAAPPPPSQPACSTPGQDLIVSSSDGRVSVHIFASMTRSIRLTIHKPIDPASVPAVPGQKVDDLLFQLVAEDCNGGPLSTLPSEANLGVRYSDADASGLTEANFKLSQLDTSANQWRIVQKQANDPSANFVSATITDLGFYVVHQP